MALLASNPFGRPIGLRLAPGTAHPVEVRRGKKRRTLFVTLENAEQQEIFID